MDANQHESVEDLRSSRSFAATSLLHFTYFWLLALAPWIVFVSKAHTVGDGGMIVVPEHQQLVGIGIIEAQLTQQLEGVRCGLLWIGVDAVCNLQAVDIGIVFDLPADGAFHGP